MTDLSLALKSDLSQKTRSFLSEHGIGCGGGGGSRSRLNVYQSSAMDNGIRCVRLEAALRRMITVYQSTARAIRKHKIRLLFYLSLSTLIFMLSAASSRTHLLSIGPTLYSKLAGEGWAHSELREPRGERRRMLIRKPIFIQTRRRKLEKNRFIAQTYVQCS